VYRRDDGASAYTAPGPSPHHHRAASDAIEQRQTGGGSGPVLPLSLCVFVPKCAYDARGKGARTTVGCGVGARAQVLLGMLDGLPLLQIGLGQTI
jgi:hypothetical protein